MVELLEAEGALVKVEDRIIATPYGDRSGVVIEPWLTDQWYVDAATLVKPVIEATRSGAIKIVPETWSKTWFNWLENIQPWCVSRQLWWGHRIPAWFDDDGNVFVAETEDEAQRAGRRRRRAAPGRRRPRHLVLLRAVAVRDARLARADRRPRRAITPTTCSSPASTSCSSGTRGWRCRGSSSWARCRGRRSTSTAWSATRTAQKMSKSKGNTVDPLGLIDQYGADALRFTMAAMESQGRDIKLDEKRVEGYRNFATKLWNAARFLQGNGVGAIATHRRARRRAAGQPLDHRRSRRHARRKLDKALADLRFDDMADAIYHFTWGTFCDWYVELVKGAWDDETRAVAAWAFDQILVMLHPFMPFITEELWHSMGERPYDLIVAKWPAPEAQRDAAAAKQIDGIVAIVDRSPRAARRAQHPVERGAGPARHRRRCGDARRA